MVPSGASLAEVWLLVQDPPEAGQPFLGCPIVISTGCCGLNTSPGLGDWLWAGCVSCSRVSMASWDPRPPLKPRWRATTLGPQVGLQGLQWAAVGLARSPVLMGTPSCRPTPRPPLGPGFAIPSTPHARQQWSGALSALTQSPKTEGRNFLGAWSVAVTFSDVPLK